MTKLLHVIFIFFICLFCVKQSNAQDDHLIDSLYKQLDESKRDTFQMKINRSIGDFYMYKNPIKAIHYFEKANELAIQNNRTLDIASNYYSIGYCSLEKGNFDHAIENYLKSVRLYIQMNDVKRLTNAYLSLSNVYS